MKEGDIAGPFGAVQARFPGRDASAATRRFEDGAASPTTLVLRSRDEARLAAAEAAVEAMLDAVQGGALSPKRA